MNAPSSSLDRLHDLVLPPEVSWWPLAPGWYALILLALAFLAIRTRRAWKNWHANAYRRAALRELASTQDASAIAELLRRTALVIAPREEIAQRTGSAWVEWLSEHSPEAVPVEARLLLTSTVYKRPTEDLQIDILRGFASRWISNHY
ncbi:MAG: DUF4381 domain-containing protein [Verrucomicrobiales bacterium]|nr:DUF4381 domain-containing protein [Verrucomicrobiae bacterium]